jgi:hypothetical protein
MQAFSLALCLSILLLPGLLLRYIPFKPFLNHQQNKRLATWYLLWFLVLFALELHQTVVAGPTVRLFKQVSMLGWLPYFLINIFCIPNHLAHHIFVAGMQNIYMVLLHGAGIFVLTFLEPTGSIVAYYFQLTALLLLLFSLTYPFVKNFFCRIFLSQHAINDHKYWRGACLLPFLIVADVIYLSYGDKIMAKELLVPRLFLLPIFIALMYAFSYDVKHLEMRAELDATNKFLQDAAELPAGKYQSPDGGSQPEDGGVPSHDIRHYNQLCWPPCSKEGKTEAAALQLITGCDDNILQTSIQSYCYNPIINAALSMYIHKAEQEQLPLTHKVDLPTTMKIDENELAILLSNLLENAFLASKKQPAGAREIKILVRTDARQLLVSVANRFDAPVRLGDDGLPVTHQNGHGLGMRSLALFRDKYQATVLCSQQEGWFKTMIYVANKY